MKLSCDVIRDLLPLYHDNICCDESRKLVAEHVESCYLCKNELEKMSLEVISSKDNLDEMIMMKRISKKWYQDTLKSLVKGFLIAVIIFSIIYIFVDFKLV